MNKEQKLKTAIKLFEHLLGTDGLSSEVRKELEGEIKVCNEKIKAIENMPYVDEANLQNPPNYVPKKIIISQDRGKKGTLTVITKRGKHYIEITKTQFELLKALAEKCINDRGATKRKRGVLTYKEIKDRVENWKSTTDDSQIRAQIKAIRDALELKSISRFVIETIPGKCYRLDIEPSKIKIE